MSTLPAMVTCWLGMFAGVLLRRGDLSALRKFRILMITGVALVALGWIWNFDFPVIKKLWTSSCVLVAGGWSFLLLGAFYYLVDIRQWQGWCRPFVWIGMNPITLYILSSVVSFHALASRLVGGSVSAWFDAHLISGAGQFLVSVVALLIVFAIARFLYVRRIFLKV